MFKELIKEAEDNLNLFFVFADNRQPMMLDFDIRTEVGGNHFDILVVSTANISKPLVTDAF